MTRKAWATPCTVQRSCCTQPQHAVTADDFETRSARPVSAGACHHRGRALGTCDRRNGRSPARAVGRRHRPTTTLDGLRERSQPELHASVADRLVRRRPASACDRSCGMWARYKEVAGQPAHRRRPNGAPRRREATRRGAAASGSEPHPDAGQSHRLALRAGAASNVYNAVFSEPGVRFADQITMEVSACPDGDVGALVADRFQPDTWYVAQAATLLVGERRPRLGGDVVVRQWDDHQDRARSGADPVT